MEWQALFEKVRRPTLLQSPDYADAVCPGAGQRARRAIIRLDGVGAGLVQVQEAALFGRAIHALILDRGPLWLEGHGTQAAIAAFFETFGRAFPARFGRKRRILPEVEADAACALDGLPLDRVAARPGYRTIWLDLSPDLERLRAGLKGKWRNMLVKAERRDLAVEWDWTGKLLEPFLARYAADKGEKGYTGPHPKTVSALARRFAPKGGCGIALAFRDMEALAGLMVLTHGRGATYQIGWVTPEGRKLAANHLLLWKAAETLKARGITDFDLGGVNDGPADGVRRFKEGLGGRNVELAGQFR